MTINLDKTIPWMPPTNSHVDNFRNEFDRIYANFGDLDTRTVQLEEDSLFVREELILTGQTVAAGVTTNQPVYFDGPSGQWAAYNPWKRAVPCLFTGSGTVALNGAVVDVTLDANYLYISDAGQLATSSPMSQVTGRETLGYRVGPNKFKIEYKKHPSRLVNAQEKITAPDMTAGDRFGQRVTIRGDLMVIGAYTEDTGATDAGSAYVYRFNGTEWEYQQVLRASNPQTSAYFGRSVAIYEDWIAVGADWQDQGASNSGAVYMFHYDGTTWTETEILTPSDQAAGDFFGRRLALYEDVLAIASDKEEANGTNPGTAYAFRYNGTNWVEEAILSPADNVLGMRFGYAIAIHGDAIAVGAFLDSSAASTAGAVYVFRYDGTNWLEDGKLTAGDAVAGDRLGYYQIGIYEDRVVAGAYRRADPSQDAGVAYVFKYDGTNWAQETKLTRPDVAGTDYFGHSLSIFGETILVSSHGVDISGIGNDVGFSHVFRYDGQSWVMAARLMANDAQAGDGFGSATCIYGDTILIGAPSEDQGGADAGAAYIFDVSDLTI